MYTCNQNRRPRQVLLVFLSDAIYGGVSSQLIEILNKMVDILKITSSAAFYWNKSFAFQMNSIVLFHNDFSPSSEQLNNVYELISYSNQLPVV